MATGFKSQPTHSQLNIIASVGTKLCTAFALMEAITWKGTRRRRRRRKKREERLDIIKIFAYHRKLSRK